MLKKLLLSITAIATVAAPAVALSSCNDKPKPVKPTTSLVQPNPNAGTVVPPEVVLPELEAIQQYKGKQWFISSICGIGNIHDQYTKQESELLKAGKIHESHNVDIHRSWAWKLLTGGTWESRNSYETILATNLLTHFCSRNRDFKMSAGDTTNPPGLVWTENAKKIIFGATPNRDGSTNIVIHVGSDPVKPMALHKVHSVSEQDETNFKKLMKNFTDFAKGELTQAQMDEFYARIIQPNATEEYKEGVKVLMTVPNDSVIKYFINDDQSIGMAFLRAKKIFYFENGHFIQKAVKPTLLTRDEFNKLQAR